jgi:hypothetical protein
LFERMATGQMAVFLLIVYTMYIVCAMNKKAMCAVFC